MKVWAIVDIEGGDTLLYDLGTDPLELDFVKSELSYLVGGYDDEREEFISNIESMKRTGRGSAEIEERLIVEIKTVG